MCARVSKKYLRFWASIIYRQCLEIARFYENEMDFFKASLIVNKSALPIGLRQAGCSVNVSSKFIAKPSSDVSRLSGTKGAGRAFFAKALKSMSEKKGWDLMALASSDPKPKRFVGSFVKH